MVTTDQVYRKHVGQIVRTVVRRLAAPVNPRVIHEDLDPAEPSNNLFATRSHLLRIAHVATQAQRRTSGVLTKLGSKGKDRVDLNVEKGKVSPVIGQGLCDGRPESLGPAGDQRHTA